MLQIKKKKKQKKTPNKTKNHQGKLYPEDFKCHQKIQKKSLSTCQSKIKPYTPLKPRHCLKTC